MENINKINPEKLFKEFCRAYWMETSSGKAAWNEFKALEDKSPFLEKAIQFVNEQLEVDEVRRWGISVLKLVGGDKAFSFLINLLKTEDEFEKKRKFPLTRLLALAALDSIVSSDEDLKELLAVCRKVSSDDDEDYRTQAMGAVLLIKYSSNGHENKIKDMLSAHEQEDCWPTWSALRALSECPLPQFKYKIFSIIDTSKFTELRRRAIHTLGAYINDSKVASVLGDIATNNSKEYFRLAAVQSLAKLQNPQSQSTLIRVLHDEDAGIREQASDALLKISSKEGAISAIIQYALKGGLENKYRLYLIDALRRIDRDLSVKVLSKELDSDDRKRVQMAEGMLVDLGGSIAVQILNQRRQTLNSLDELLAKSEQAVKNSFEDTICQARRNFYFAMGVNILIVLIGLILIALAVNQLIKDPGKLEAWIIPGGAGVVGVLINLVFNNPRENARRDLTALMNVNVIFLGFLRQLNEIDATFKHAYLESHEFGTAQMKDTVCQIESTMRNTLKMVDSHLCILQQNKETKGDEA